MIEVQTISPKKTFESFSNKTDSNGHCINQYMVFLYDGRKQRSAFAITHRNCEKVLLSLCLCYPRDIYMVLVGEIMFFKFSSYFFQPSIILMEDIQNEPHPIVGKKEQTLYMFLSNQNKKCGKVIFYVNFVQKLGFLLLIKSDVK